MTTPKHIHNIGTARFIRKVDAQDGGTFRGDARLFALSSPIPYWPYGPNVDMAAEPLGTTRNVVVVVDGVPTKDGTLLPLTTVWAVTKDAAQIDGDDDSLNTNADFCLQIGGWLSHERALNMLGFEAVGGIEAVDPNDILEVAQREASDAIAFEFSAGNDLAAMFDGIDPNDFTDEDGGVVEQDAVRDGTTG